MILVDTDVWLAFARREPKVARLVQLLRRGVVEVHPLVLAELQLAVPVAQRRDLLPDLEELASRPPLSHDDVMTFLEAYGLRGSGVGYVEAHVLASAFKERRRLWSLDPLLRRVAQRLGVALRGH